MRQSASVCPSTERAINKKVSIVFGPKTVEAAVITRYLKANTSIDQPIIFGWYGNAAN